VVACCAIALPTDNTLAGARHALASVAKKMAKPNVVFVLGGPGAGE
jgi:hypothetical protein